MIPELFVLIGLFFLFYAMYSLTKFLRLLEGLVYKDVWKFLGFLIGVFIIGFGMYLFFLITGFSFVHVDLIVSIVFLFASIFVVWALYLNYSTVNDLKLLARELREVNASLAKKEFETQVLSKKKPSRKIPVKSKAKLKKSSKSVTFKIVKKSKKPGSKRKPR
ncbi:MAG: hypothetical protein GOV15_02490 [Candidatus Diapherotrites archaeon]|nr:hypothetical protein [Candidatus Diapherotrites archaeon]